MLAMQASLDILLKEAYEWMNTARTLKLQTQKDYIITIIIMTKHPNPTLDWEKPKTPRERKTRTRSKRVVKRDNQHPNHYSTRREALLSAPFKSPISIEENH